MSIEEVKLSASAVQVGMHVIMLGHRCFFSIVKKPYGGRGGGDTAYLNLISSSRSIDMGVQAIMEKMVAATSLPVSWANPDTSGQ